MTIETRPAPLADDSTASKHRAPVLVIDDTPEGAASTTSDLGDAGYLADSVADGDAALRSVRAELTRLVISELYIACSEGPCVVSALKNDRLRLPRLRVLTFSRHTTPSDDAWALAAGADGVLHKPASARALVGEVRRLDGKDPRLLTPNAEQPRDLR